MSYIRARAKQFGLAENFYQKIDVHVHVPEGAVPKDGPSAGIAITTAILSALTKNPIKRTVGATGEVTLRGKVLEIGGVKEKVIAAHRAGLKTIILPKENKKDLEDVPKEVLKDLTFQFVSHLDEVLPIALTKELHKNKKNGDIPQASIARPVLHAPQPS
jgi:ATP-dependent Lon protease